MPAAAACWCSCLGGVAHAASQACAPFLSMSHQLLVGSLLREAPIPQHHHMVSRGQVLQLVGHQDARGLRRGAAAVSDVRLNAKC